MKSVLYRIVCGFAIGIGCVLPGVSGGILAVSLGMYEKIMSAIGNFFSGMRANFRYLLPIAIGGGIGVLLTSNVLSIVIERYEAPLLALFSGLVLGSMPELYKEVKTGGRVRLRHVIAAVCGLAFVLIFALGESSVSANEKVVALTIPAALIAGAVLSIGTVIPGVSSSFILIYLGLYNAVITALAGIFDLSTLVQDGFSAALARLGTMIVPLLFMTLGFAAVSILIIRGVNRALKHHHALSYAAVIGFVVGSVALIVPGVVRQFTWSCPIAFAAGLAASLLQFRFKSRLAGADVGVQTGVAKEIALQQVPNQNAD